MTFKAKDEGKVITDTNKIFGITWMDNIELTNYKKMYWDEFLDILELQTMKNKPTYNIKYIKNITKIMTILGYELKESTIYYYKPETPNEALPLVIEFDELAILLAPIINNR